MLDLLRVYFCENKIDALLVTDATNIFYLSGFKGSNAYALITKNHAYLLTDSRYFEKAEKAVSDDWRVLQIHESLNMSLCNTSLKHRVKILGVEAHSLTLAKFEKLQNMGCPINVKSTHSLVERVRMIKKDQELRAIRESQKLNEQVLKIVLKELKPGITEAVIAWKIRMIAKGIKADGLSFPPIVAFGANSSMPHHEPSPKKKLKRGDLVLIDMGLVVKNFTSDMTRTFFTKPPTKQQQDVYETVLEGQLRAIKMVVPGVTCDDVDRAARKFICHSGYHKKFGHATGHGIGLDVHEVPSVAKANPMQLEPGMVITIEPGIYIPGRLGVRIEDMIEVTATGKKVLTKFPKKLSDSVLKI